MQGGKPGASVYAQPGFSQPVLEVPDGCAIAAGKEGRDNARTAVQKVFLLQARAWPANISEAGLRLRLIQRPSGA